MILKFYRKVYFSDTEACQGLHLFPLCDVMRRWTAAFVLAIRALSTVCGKLLYSGVDHRPIGRHRRSEHRKSTTSLILTLTLNHNFFCTNSLPHASGNERAANAYQWFPVICVLSADSGRYADTLISYTLCSPRSVPVLVLHYPTSCLQQQHISQSGWVSASIESVGRSVGRLTSLSWDDDNSHRCQLSSQQ